MAQRIARFVVGQAVLTRPRIKRVVQVSVQATTVREPIRFVLRELSASGRLSRYRLRGSGRPVFVRHNTADPLVLDEVFYTGHYETPPEVATVLDGLGRPPRVVDLGANIGLFGVWTLERWPDAQIVAFEPDRANAAVARLCIEANGAAEQWRLIEAAAADRDGRVSFISGDYSRSRIGDGTDEVEAVDTFPYLDDADFVKVDIEGGEWALVADPRFDRLTAPVLVLEYHRDQAPGPDPQADALAAVRRAGYEARVVAEFEPGQGLLWGWRRPQTIPAP
ncbi:MAG: FkbM family methyltransferase [Gaiellaceae bacterium]